MNLQQLKAFTFVAKEKSFSKAASRLSLSQSTISSHIISLEQEFNTTLFVRSTRSVSLTQSGKKLLEYTEKIINIEDQINYTFFMTPNDSSRITISASTVPYQYLLPDILASYNLKYPLNKYYFLECNSQDVVKNIDDDIADIGFCHDVSHKPTCNNTPLIDDELMIITPNIKEYQELDGEEFPIDLLKTSPIIMQGIGSRIRHEVEIALKNLDMSLNDLKVLMSMNNYEAIKKLVAQEFGIAFLPRLSCKTELENNRLLAFSFPSGKISNSLYMIYNNHKPNSYVSHFVDLVNSIYK